MPIQLKRLGPSGQHITGHTIGNDVSERSLQLEDSGGQWSKGNTARHSAPWALGSWGRNPPLIRKHSACRPRSSSASDTFFPVRYLIWHLSQYMMLEPYLRDRDVIELESDQIGQQRQLVRD